MSPKSRAFRRAVACAALALGACRSFRSDDDLLAPIVAGAPEEGPASRPLSTDEGPPPAVVGVGFLKKKQTVRLRGRFDRGRFYAREMELHDDDKEVELKGPLGAFDRAAGSGDVGGVPFRIPDDAKLVGEDGAPAPDDAATRGRWVKAELKADDGVLRLLKLQLRERKPGEDETLFGRIDRIEDGRRLVVAGVEVVHREHAEVTWKRDEAPPPLEQRAVTQAEAPRPRRRIYEDPDDWRPDTSLVVGNVLTVGGQLRYDLELRENHDLDETQERDRLLHDAIAKVEVSADLHRNVFAFGSVNFAYGAVHFDEESDVELGDRIQVEELFVRFEDLPFDGLAVQLGRQRFDHGREFLVRDDWDAARLVLNTDVAAFEFSVGQELFDPDPENVHVTNWLGTVRFEPFEDNVVELYWLKRKSGSPRALDRDHFGISGEGDFGGGTKWWAEVGFSRGFEDEAPLRGYGLDVGLLQVFKKAALRPYVYAGFALGSGDDVLDDGVDQNFRQSGLHRNNDRFGGVAGFRYYGEVFRPDLQNLQIFTAGLGIRPTPGFSMDLVFHSYRQDAPFLLLGPSRLRRNPNGLHPELGYGVDLIIGLEDWRPLEIEIDLGYFQPGPAFDAASDAWYGVLT
ncbi:MAG TPA: alginate export family protein, partial [Planctomycetota bacterium]|nr:alginate export family protein [Planctomycetota bacterium]